MIIALTVWALIGAAISVSARRVGSSWRRAMFGFIWPTFPVLIVRSRIKYVRRRRSLA